MELSVLNGRIGPFDTSETLIDQIPTSWEELAGGSESSSTSLKG